MFAVGDRVRVKENAKEILKATAGRPGWNDDMEDCIGEEFVISRIDSWGYIRFSGTSGNSWRREGWAWLPECLEYASREDQIKNSPVIRKIRYLNNKFYKKQLSKGKDYALCMLR